MRHTVRSHNIDASRLDRSVCFRISIGGMRNHTSGGCGRSDRYRIHLVGIKRLRPRLAGRRVAQHQQQQRRADEAENRPRDLDLAIVRVEYCAHHQRRNKRAEPKEKVQRLHEGLDTPVLVNDKEQRVDARVEEAHDEALRGHGRGQHANMARQRNNQRTDETCAQRNQHESVRVKAVKQKAAAARAGDIGQRAHGKDEANLLERRARLAREGQQRGSRRGDRQANRQVE